MMKKVVVTGAGGFVGGHLVKYLRSTNHWVRGVDVRYPLWDESDAHEFLLLDLRYPANAAAALRGMEEVYALAADMGGMGFIDDPKLQATIGFNNAMINMSTLEAARHTGTISKYVFTSSVCVYPMYRLKTVDVKPLREEDAYPADPQKMYGWEKLWTEQLVEAYRNQYGLNTHIVRLQNTFGPNCEWRDAKDCPEGHRTKAPAALARKIAIAKLTGDPEVEIWGDGLATRSFMYCTDCVRGIYMIGDSKHHEPVTLGPDQTASINAVVNALAYYADFEIEKKYVAGPQGVRGRNFNHQLVNKIGWQPKVSLRQGLYILYNWVETQVRKSLKRKA